MELLINMISYAKWVCKKGKTKRIIISFSEDADGKINTAIKINKAIPVDMAIGMLDRLSFNIKAGLTNRANAAGLNHKNPKTRAFIKQQTLGDVI